MEIYEEHSKGQPIKAFINVGGGIASLGNTVNGQLIPPGLNENLPVRNFPVRGVIIEMGKAEIPVIHIMNIKQLLAKYGLPYSPVPMPEPGEGGIFVHREYNLIITAIATLFLIVVIVLVYLSEQKFHRLGTDLVPSQKANRAVKDDTENIHDL